MTFTNKNCFLLYFFIFILTLSQAQNREKLWQEPLDIPLLLSGNFAELRGTHFHAGLDLKTNGREGLEVKSIGSGFVSRIRVSTSGYGKVLYLNHPNGTVSVYAHLKKFAPKIEAYVKARQYEKQSYTLQLLPKAEELKVELGELIGYSGNTGGSSGPHLHFEMRDGRDQSPINPLSFPIKIEDHQRPQIQAFYVYENHTPSKLPKSYALTQKNDSLFTTNLIKTAGLIHVGLGIFDRQDSSYNKNGVYRIQVWVNGIEIYNYQMDRFLFTDSKFIPLIVDYYSLRENRNKIHQLYWHPKTKLSFLKDRSKNGRFEVEPGKSYQLLIKTSDYSNNATWVETYIEGVEANKSEPETPKGKSIHPEQDYLFEFGEKSVYFQKNTFFDTVHLDIESSGDSLMVDRDRFPLVAPLVLQFPYPSMDSLERAQSAIALLRNNRRPSLLNTARKSSHLTAKSSILGTFAVLRDSLAPTILPINFRDGQNLKNFRYLKIRLKDDFSGVKNYSAYINDEWVLFEHEPKTNTLTFDFNDLEDKPRRLDLKVVANDRVGNSTTYRAVLFQNP